VKLPAHLSLSGKRKGSFTLTPTSFDKLTTPLSLKGEGDQGGDLLEATRKWRTNSPG
jgi:hypothetical protein